MSPLRASASLLLCCVLGCQSYELSPTTPVAVSQFTQQAVAFGRRQKPNVVFLVDRSGSMDEPTDEARAGCQVGGSRCGPSPRVACDTAVCPTRWSEVTSAMTGFLQAHGQLARMGLALFPAPNAADSCAPAASGLDVAVPQVEDDSPELQRSANAIAAALLATHPGGGTPTGASVRLLATDPALLAKDGREDFIVLLTDGVPNCNDANAQSCTCTLTSGCSGPFARKGCLDDRATVDAISQVRLKGLKTFVVGFGAELTSAEGSVILNQMAEAGGEPRTCGGAQSCGADACDPASSLCAHRYYQAGTREQLAEVLTALGNRLPPGEACKFNLIDPQVDPAKLSLWVNGQAQPKESWRLSGTQGAYVLTAEGSLCEQISSATADGALQVEIKTLTVL